MGVNMNLIFDIGSNFGEFAKQCLVTYGFDTKILCVEANPYIVGNPNLVLTPNITMINYAVAAEDNMELDFYINDKAHVVSTVSRDWIEKSRFAEGGGWRAPIKVKTITLDSLIKRYGNPDYIKIDVEGYEYEVLRGLSQKSGLVAFEWSEELFNTSENCARKLQSLGYTEFAYTQEDKYNIVPDNFTKWEESEIHKIIDRTQKIKWGMIYAK